MVQIHDIKKEHTILIIFAVIGVWGVITIPELYNQKDYPDYDFFTIETQQWTPQKILSGYDLHVRDALGKFSDEYLGNIKIVPFILSGCLLGVTYLLGTQLSGKRYGGILALCFVTASGIFRAFDTSAVYANGWSLFFIMSLYFIRKQWYLNPVFFVLSLLSKPLAILFLPAVIVWIIKEQMPLQRKIALGIFYCFIVIFMLIGSKYYGQYHELPFNLEGFLDGLDDWIFFFLVPDFWVSVTMPMVMLFLAILWKKGIGQTTILLVSMLNLSLFNAILQGLTDDIWGEPYRFIPLLVITGSSLGVIVEGVKQRIKQKEELRNNLGKV